MLINEILKNPIVKICAVFVILYFALFSNKENPDSLRNRLSKENIEKNLHDASNKSKFIISNVGAAKKAIKEKERKEQEMQNLVIKCGDEVTTDYSIFSAGQNLYSEKNKKFIIGSKIDPIIEKNVIGMKNGETKVINIMDGIKSDQKLNIPKPKNNINYHIKIVSIENNSASSSNSNCK
jgi:hypothetical protein